MRCPRAQMLLSLRRDGALDPRRADGLEEHLAACPACRRFAQALAVCEERLNELATVVWEPQPEFVDRFRARLEQTPTQTAAPRRRPAWRLLLQAAAAAAALFVGSRLADSLENGGGALGAAPLSVMEPADTLYAESFEPAVADPLDGIDLTLLTSREK